MQTVLLAKNKILPLILGSGFALFISFVSQAASVLWIYPLKKGLTWEFPGGPVVRTLHSQLPRAWV